MGTANFRGFAPPPKTIWELKIKPGTTDYVGEGNLPAKFGNIEITGDYPHLGEI